VGRTCLPLAGFWQTSWGALKPRSRWAAWRAVFHDFQHLPLDDSAHAIQIRAALAFNLAGIRRFPPQPEKRCSLAASTTKPGHGNQILPIGEKVFQGRYLNAAQRFYKSSPAM